MENPEKQYLQLIRDILKKGSVEEGRNGTTHSIFGYSMRFSLKDGTLPLLTTKRVAWKTCFNELMWFVRGSTNNKELIDKGVHIWDANASREFLDGRGLTSNYVNDLGPVYGHQWRHFNAPYSDCFENYKDKGIDQLQQIIDQLRSPEGRTSRRLVMTAWNPCQLDQMALPPCHVLVQFHVREQKYLSCSLYQRSGDVGLGVPFNIASYSFLTHILAKHCDLIAEDFVYFLGNAHIYESHLGALREQLLREPMPFPKISLNSKHDAIEDYVIEDIEWKSRYQYHEALKMDMVA
jgi:thymidylate synthase